MAKLNNQIPEISALLFDALSEEKVYGSGDTFIYDIDNKSRGEKRFKFFANRRDTGQFSFVNISKESDNF